MYINDLPAPLERMLEEQFHNFERDTDWRISLPARVVIHQGLLAMSTDRLGLFEINESQRLRARRNAISALPEFLHYLREQGTPMAYQLENSENAHPDDARILDAIFVMQRLHWWA